MKLIQLTARKFQYVTADSIYTSNLAEAFQKKLGDDYLLIVAGKATEQFKKVNILNLNLKVWSKRTLYYYWLPYFYYFFWLPAFIFKNHKGNETVFFASDTNLSVMLIFWKKVFRFNYKICSDWHMLYRSGKVKSIAGQSDYLITTSSRLKNLILGIAKISESKILVAYGGVALEKFKPVSQLIDRKSLALPDDKKLIGYVGFFKTMGMTKGIDTMISSLKYLPEKIKMVFIGGQAEEIEFYRQYAKKLGIASRIILIGRKNFEEIAAYEQALDILVIPYPNLPHFRNYGFPMKVYEYMAARKPIIYSHLELIEEVLADCAFTFTSDAPDDLAEKIKFVLDKKNEVLVKRKVSLAYEKVINLTWSKKAEKIINFINS